MSAATLCSRCRKSPPREGQRYCQPCHAEYTRDWRKNHPMNEGQKKRDNARSYAATYLKRGKIAPMACEACGSPDAEMHHQDHERPLDVNWLCRPCHLAWHAFWRTTSRQAFGRWLALQIKKQKSSANRRAA